MRSDIINLIKQESTLDEYGIPQTVETSREVYCEVHSITQTEFFSGGAQGLKPEYKFTMFEGDYEDEKMLSYKDARYVIYRTYRTGDIIELYVERRKGEE